ncbi:hypothetical protein MNBD_GAMMA09-1078 [hydrothermal vent metagenome]|uniref:NAD(P)-binding domain-containing protein n=1 Tax=hydrothermal vent metagenome TaxID=652676 RepID=A0A3B0Y0F9_9ZZZZ
MNIHIIGVSGFIGSSIYTELVRQGHQVSGCSRKKVENINWEPCDFSNADASNTGALNAAVECWESQLKNIDVVINAVGIYQESEKQGFSQVQTVGPKKLFDVCIRLKIYVIQISAMGAEKEYPVNEFLKSKKNADQYLIKNAEKYTVLYPGIVLGEQGKTTQQLSLLARSRCIPMVFKKHSRLPLISIYQLNEAVVNIISDWQSCSDISMKDKKNRIKILVAKTETIENLLNNMRLWMKQSDSYMFLYIPEKLTQWFFALFPGVSIGAFNRQSIQMVSDYALQSKSVMAFSGEVGETASESLMGKVASGSYIKNIKLTSLYYINILTLSFIWILSGVSSLVSMEKSREIIELAGVVGYSGDVIIIVAAIFDLLMGVLLWLSKLRRNIIYIQILIMVIYSLLITYLIPAYWLHPFAPVIKNFAMLVMALYLLLEEDEHNV